MDILSILPHRPPFLFVDEVVDVIDNERIEAVWRFSGGEHFFRGHFPQKPILPGVLQIEALAQAGLILAYKSGLYDPKCQLGFLAQVQKIRFKQIVCPPGELHLFASNPRLKMGVAFLDVEARFRGHISAKGQLQAVIAKKTT